MIEAQENFMRLPANIRKRFDNDPAQLIEFINDPNNLDEAINIGLAKEPEKPLPGSKVDGVGDGSPPSPSNSTGSETSA